MNLITDTLSEIRNMKFRKVLTHFLHFHCFISYLVPSSRTELRHDSLLSTYDLEVSHDRD